MVLVGIAIALRSSKALNLLLLGETQALTLGLNLSQMRVVIIVNVSILAGTVTAFCGPIAFIGIAVPHLGRALLKTADHRLLIPAVMVLGANLALAADLVAQLPGQQTTLPLNTVTALLGVPIVLGVILRK
jgi:iron complex transport system permease protein